MKASIKSFKMLKFLLITLPFSQISFSQAPKNLQPLKAETTGELVANKSFIFLVTTVLPTGGAARQLTSYYDIKITKDTLISNLPYFGRAYSAPIGTTDGGINFTSAKFEYTISDRKKGGWDILIKLKDQDDFKQMSFTVFDNGSASLNINSNNRDPISFNGYIAENR